MSALDENGRFMAFTELYPINERKQVQLVLLDSEGRFRSFMDNSNCVAFVKARAGSMFTSTKCSGESITSANEVIGKTDAELYPEKIYRKLRSRDLEIWRSGETWSGIEDVPVISGELRHWWVVKFLFHNSAGEQFLGGWAMDMTERFQSEENPRVLLDEPRMPRDWPPLGNWSRANLRAKSAFIRDWQLHRATINVLKDKAR